MADCQIRDENGTVRRTVGYDDLFRVLADGRRRAVVAALERHEDDWIDLETLATRLAETREGTVTDWRTELHHHIVPMLADLGPVDYDRRAGRLRYYDCEALVRVLEAVE